MKVSRSLYLLLAALSTTALILGYWGLTGWSLRSLTSEGAIIWLSVSLGLAFLWLAARLPKWAALSSAGLIACLVVAALGVFLGAPPLAMLVASVFGLAAWDLAQFNRRFEGIGRVEAAAEIEGRHLKRLLVVGGVGLALGAAALFVRVRLSFAVILLLGLLTFLGLSQVVRRGQV